MKKQSPKISDLKVLETLGVDDCKECVLQSYCVGDCPLEIQKHYEL